MSESVKIFKIGGNVADSPEALAAFLDEFVAVEGRKMLVHGGGKEATRLCRALGVETEMINGRRVTGRDTLDVVTMVYAGLVNKRIVAMLQARGCDALGLSGADAGIVRAHRRPAQPVDYGYVGDILPQGVDTSRLLGFIDQGITPVVCAIMHDGEGTLLNCNADSVASSIAMALAGVASVELIFCFEKAGVLADIDNPASLVGHIRSRQLPSLIESGTVSGGMIPKVENAVKAVEAGVLSVTIRSSKGITIPGGTRITL